MSKLVKRLLAAAAGASFLVLLPAAPAMANVYNCVDASEWGPGCDANVTAISPGSSLVYHNQPNYSGGQVPNTPHFHNGDVIFLQCWTTGSGDADGHGDHYWFRS